LHLFTTSLRSLRNTRTATKAAAALTCTALLSATFFVGGTAATAAPVAPGTETSNAQGEQVGAPAVAPAPAPKALDAGQAPAAGSGAVTERGAITEGATPAGGSIDRTNSQQITDVFNAINAFRATKGLKAVTFNATVSEMAEDWSETMATSGTFAHNPSFHTDSRVAGRWTMAAEIIAGRPDYSGAGLVDQWIASAPHNAIMSDPGFTTIGVGIARVQNEVYLLGTVNFFNFEVAPAGSYTTAADFLNGGSEISGPFADVPAGTQFAGEINWLASKGISTGWNVNGTTTYRPVTPVNRDAMAAFMFRLARLGGQPDYTPPYYSWFDDVAPGTQFYKEMNWMAEYGISGGWDEGNGQYTYRPLTTVKRDAMAAFLYRLAGEPAFTPPATSPFADVTTSTQFYKEITWLASVGISSGWDEGNGRFTYRPFNSVNRDAMAAFMYRLYSM
jgi:uncharacterized protein YkwD